MRLGSPDEPTRTGGSGFALRQAGRTMLWLIPVTIVIVGAVAFIRGRRHGDPTSEPISGQWLAEKRGREEQNW